ncbi:MAG: DUF4342 domain-containing protein [Eubacterium sp.]|jgi:ElaB/YqjD/DUF883 family membrane-anchored ribosome-binding protein
MEITLEKIELVRDRTGVTYKQAKEALEKTDGNVVDAIIAIEEMNEAVGPDAANKKANAASDKTGDLIKKMKEIVSKGNVSRIVVKKDDEIILNIPLTAGLLGIVIAPYGMIAGVVATLGFRCRVEFVKTDGTVIDLTDRASEAFKSAKEKSGDVYNAAKEKGSDLYDKARDAAGNFTDKMKKSADDIDVNVEEFTDKVEDAFDDVKESAEETVSDIKEEAEELKDEVKKDFK